jgi:poly(3-hydroxyalkanoate) synthetase
VAHRATILAGDLAHVGLGRSTLAAAPANRRFTDPAWTANPLLRRLVQAYLAAGRTAEGLVADADLEWRDAQQVRLLVDSLVQALAPSNQPLSSPVFELLQYRPRTPRVRRVPLLVVPPMINKYYILDLAPGRSLVEYLADSGQQVFVVSWRNPDAATATGAPTPTGQAILEALAATRRICRVDRSALLGMCSGGILAVMALAHLAAVGGQDAVAGFGLAVAVLDQARAGTAAAFLDDLIWPYWINNYLQGRTPAPFDILYWNADTARLTAALHRDFIRLAVANALTRPGEAALLGSPVDLGTVDTDAYLVAGAADHLCPWQACYHSTQLLGGHTRFVLFSGGHIAAMVNPPGTRPRRLGAAGLPPLDPAPGTYVLDR